MDRSVPSSSPEPEAKRRKLRKGATSCWECKKRKVKCIFEEGTDAVCFACRRRGVQCIGQDQTPQEPRSEITDKNEVLANRLRKLEQTLENIQRAETQDLGPTTPFSNVHSSNSSYQTVSFEGFSRWDITNTDFHQQEQTPAQTHDRESIAQFPTPISDATRPTPQSVGSVMHVTQDCENVSIDLRRAFPLQEDIDVVCKSDYVATFFCYQIFTRSGNRSKDDAVDVVNNLAIIPDPYTTSPVLMAKRMIILALILQYFRCSNALSENPGTIADRLVETAARSVTTNDQFVSCIDGLECIILEAIYQTNCGNLRRAWMTVRKAMNLAQLLKVDRSIPQNIPFSDPNCKLDPKIMWFRIVHMDSYLSLMLGLPHGAQPTNMENAIAGETVSCTIQRAHTLIARQIIDRNRDDQMLRSIELTRQLDRELLHIAQSLPDKYWLPPDFTNLQSNTKETFWEQMRLRDQLDHHNLVHLLHLPFLLQSSKESEYHLYAKITCINAAREILTRFISFRNFNRLINNSCRISDFFALMAGMTILLAHIDSHRGAGEDFRAHQRLGDRAMVEQLIESMEVAARLTTDPLTSKSAEQLQRLLEVEGEAARGTRHMIENTVNDIEDRCGDQLQLSIPYFGIVKIGTSGITKLGPTQQGSTIPPINAGQPELVSHVGMSPATFEQQAMSTCSAMSQDQQRLDPSHIAFPSPSNTIWDQQQWQQYPGVAASMDDWTFQGVDAAFFDSLMRGTGSWE
jgi:hypothetical protein